MKWQLWTATEHRGNFPPEEQRVMNEQRRWMYDYLRQVAIARHPNGVPLDEAKLKPEYDRLTQECFDNLLSPFFDGPMSKEQFAAFCRQVMSVNEPRHASKQIFYAAASARSAEMTRRWSAAGFPVRLVHPYGTHDFDFAAAGEEWDVNWRWDHKPDGRHVLLEVEENGTLEPPAELGQKDIQSWLAETKTGDLSFDAQTGGDPTVARREAGHPRESSSGGPSNRIPLAVVRKRLTDRPLESIEWAQYQPAQRKPQTISQWWRQSLAVIGLAARPTLVLETGKGKLVVLRVERNDDQKLLVRGRAWPRPPYLPFHAGDETTADGAPGK